MYDSYEHPSNYRFKFQINSYTQPSKDEIKAHWRNKQPFVYYGTAEYYVSDIDTTIKQILKIMVCLFLRLHHLMLKGLFLQRSAYCRIKSILYVIIYF